MKNRKSRKSMLISSAAMLLVSAIALSTATYAWFTSGNTATVGNFNFQAQTAGGIQISADGTNWQTTLTQDMLQGKGENKFPAAAENATYAVWNPMSSGGNVTSGELGLFSAKLANGTISSAAATPNDTYIKFDFYVQNTSNAAVDFKLDFTEGETPNKSEVTNITETTSTGIENAVRVALIRQAGKTVGDPADISATKGGTTAWIWEPNATAHKNSSYTGAKPTYGVIAATGADGVPSYDNRFHSASIGDAYDASRYVTLQTAGQKDGNDMETGFHYKGADETKMQIGKLPANSITKFTAYIWLEGQDVDCTNFESGGTISVKLAFCGDSVAQGN